jgi:hypothetical protein
MQQNLRFSIAAIAGGREKLANPAGTSTVCGRILKENVLVGKKG